MPTKVPDSRMAGLQLADKDYRRMLQEESEKVTGLWAIQ
jgi:hypothetical protein